MNKVNKCIRRDEKACVQLHKFCPAESDCTVHSISYTGDKYPDNKIFKCSNYCCNAR